ncbi:hypothetical protein MesoLj113c_12460 [Mesorhizobium sp. 113-3-9]|uniref:hypothetical protein n=1 Tax=Mesorhizobium sp. 113-3-9 TaxID=2744517 RepID=UPI001926CD5A|nr:hypothetical protein [Mesorhizobium sp. 113-3-9]BCG85136.1 hypothetical protein MesoLj113c_12460 [Mesorhizobium sp. 113-3-9]
MIFTKLGLAIAWLLVVVSGLRVVAAFAIAYTTGQATAPRYFGSKTTGEVIDQGLIYLLIGVAVGIVAEISRSVAVKAELKKHRPEQESR